jgi:lysophospholipase L1-like esterase
MSVMRSGLETILDAFAESMVVVLGVGDMATIPRLPQPLAGFARARARSAGRMQRSVADRRAHVLYVSMYELAGPTFRSTPGLFLPDLFHPNAVGHRVWADAAAPTIERAVRHLTKPKEPLP